MAKTVKINRSAITGKFVKKSSTYDIEKDERPSHDELGERNKISNIDVADHIRFRHGREVANKNEEAEIVSQEKESGGNNEVAFLAYKLTIFAVVCNSVPVDVIRFSILCCFLTTNSTFAHFA